MSAPTVQNILNKEGLGSRYERWLKLDQELAEQGMELTAEQVLSSRSRTPPSRRGT